MVRWLNPDEVPTLMAPAYSVRVLDALSNKPASEPASRAHDGTVVLNALNAL